MDQQLPKPADILLHYNYGAAAVKQWGKNTTVLTNRPDIPRPAVTSMRPTRVKHDPTTEAVDSEAQGQWDEDDVMLFFWGNSQAARERHAQKEQERAEYVEKWRAGATGSPVNE